VQAVVDSGLWLAYFTGQESPATDLLDSLIGKAALVVGDLVVAEVLRGLPDELHRKQAEEALLRFWLVEMGGFDVAIRSATNLHTLRGRGFEVTSAECLIATFCIERGYALLHDSEAYAPFERLGLQALKAA
jgi:predicted nucleic acid-binding protein